METGTKRKAHYTAPVLEVDIYNPYGTMLGSGMRALSVEKNIALQPIQSRRMCPTQRRVRAMSRNRRSMVGLLVLLLLLLLCLAGCTIERKTDAGKTVTVTETEAEASVQETDAHTTAEGEEEQETDEGSVTTAEQDPGGSLTAEQTNPESMPDSEPVSTTAEETVEVEEADPETEEPGIDLPFDWF